jgi:glutathione S-transferase
MVAGMITLHDCRCSANGHKVRLLLSQLDRPYRLTEVDIFGGESKTDAYLALNPDGRIPLLVLEDGRALPESNAILCHLAEGTPLSAADPFERAQILQWLFFEQNRIEPVIGTARFWLLTGRAASRRQALEIKQGQAKEALGVIERHLQRRTFLGGERYTIADLSLHAYTQLAPDAGVDLQPFPAVRAWLDRVRARPGQVPGVDPYPPHAMAS